MGLVFGDIGTSPIYTLAVIFLTTPATEQNILGVLSLIIWTLILIITGQYAWLAMSLGKKGEGGTIVLRELLLPLLRKGRTASFVTLITILGISLLMGDGVITPAISILSAVEGLELIPGLEGLAQGTLILIAAVIAILLFSFQRRGTERVAFAFGPIMVVWFAVLTLTGLVSLIQAPFMVGAFNPLAGIAFLGEQRDRRILRPLVGDPLRDRRRGALRRHGPPRPRPDPQGLGVRLRGARDQLPRPGSLPPPAPAAEQPPLRDVLRPGPARSTSPSSSSRSPRP